MRSFAHLSKYRRGEETKNKRLTGLAEAVQLPADSPGVDRHHADGVFSVRGQLGKQDSRLLPSNLGLIEEK